MLVHLPNHRGLLYPCVAVGAVSNAYALLPVGDHGDQDVEDALKEAAAGQGGPVALHCFGHMHNNLNFRLGAGHRNMVAIDGATGTAYVNAAQVPRLRPDSDGRQRHHFVVVELAVNPGLPMHGIVTSAADVWVAVNHGETPDSCEAAVVPLIQTVSPPGADTIVRKCWQAFTGSWSMPIATRLT